tara:strand:- start:192 stop:1214 length:1023 start_codon:yes stop_codon:yes gene_type:complete
VNPSNTEPGPLKSAFKSQDWLGGFSKGEVIAWFLSVILWISISGGVFDDDSWTDLWISSIIGFFVIFLVLYPSFILHNWSNEKPLLTGEILKDESITEFLHFSIKRESDLVNWSRKKGLIILSISIILWAIVLVIGTIILAELLILFGGGIDLSYEVSSLITQISLLVIFLFLIYRSMGFEYAKSMFRMDSNWMNVAWLVLIVMSIDLIIESSLFAMIENIGIEVEEESYWYDPESVNNLMIYSLAVVNMVILAPVMEEVVFRGYVLDSCRGFFQEREAVIISSCLFGLIHFFYGPIGIVMISIGGALYAWIRLRTNSIIPAIICHSLWNAIQIMAFGFS